MARYILSPRARVDLQSIWSFIAVENREAADRMIDELLAAFEYLADWPGSGHTRRDLTERNFLFWPVRSYLVVYREKQAPLQIVAILHGARDIPSVLRSD